MSDALRKALKIFADLGVGSGPDHETETYRIERGAIRNARAVLDAGPGAGGDVREALRGYATWLRNYHSNPRKYHDPMPMVAEQLDIIAAALAKPDASNASAEARQALRYLADNDRPQGGQSRFNAEHLLQIADGIAPSGEAVAAIKEAIDCITDLGSGKGGWAWEEVVQRLSALSAGGDEATKSEGGIAGADEAVAWMQTFTNGQTDATTDKDKADHWQRLIPGSPVEPLFRAKARLREGDIRWAVNVLLEIIAKKFEAHDTLDIWRSDAASLVRGFKHDLAIAGGDEATKSEGGRDV